LKLGVLISPVGGNIGVGALMAPVTIESGGGGGGMAPGLSMSPAYAGTLSTRARIAAVQIAFMVFIVFSPGQFDGLGQFSKLRWKPTAKVSDEVHNSYLSSSNARFLA
jgi:hypothetical protein